jgi:integrase
MNRKRAKRDGLPYRVYDRRGLKIYSIGYKLPNGTWAFRLKCPITDRAAIIALRAEAIRRAGEIGLGRLVEDTVNALIDAWLTWQDRLPLNSPDRRADTTMAENRREIVKLRAAFGHMTVADLIKKDAYDYLDACVLAHRPAKGNKEISLMRSILERGVRMGMIVANPFDSVARNETIAYERLVTDAEINLAIRVGRIMGGPPLIVALALKTAWLCLRRSVEVRALTRAQITSEGIQWSAAKRRRGASARIGIIEWSPELRATIDEVLAIKRNKQAGEWYVFGNMQGQRYTKGGWKITLSRLMQTCTGLAATEGIPFQRFSLQDCRPKGVTDKLTRGDDDVIDATMHTSERMIRQTYDRRRVRRAKPAR